VSAIVAAVTVVAIPDTVASKTKAAVCSIFSGKDCDPGKDVNAGGPPSPGSSQPVQPPTTATAPASSGPVSAEETEYDKAKQEADQAEKDAKAAEGEFAGLDKELLDFLIDLIGITDAKNCLTKGDIVACISAAADFVPWGKAFKLLKKLPKAFKLAKKFKNIWDKVDAARKRRKAAKDRLDKALEACKRKPHNSFAPGTLVLFADGSHSPIQDIRVGDLVWARDPTDGRSGSRPVTGLISRYGRKHLVDVAVDVDGSPGGRAFIITATDEHPFWVTNARAWIDAQDLVYGDQLTTADGRLALVTATHERIRTQRAYNLTIEDLHTYHVTVAGHDILVHNDSPPGTSGEGCGDAAEDAAKLAKRKAWDDALGNPSSLQGIDPEDVKKMIPEDWVSSPQKKGKGTKYVNPHRKGEQVLIEEGWPGAKDPVHAGPYIKISRNGKIERIPLKGNPALP
jgi:hypothetical protein